MDWREKLFGKVLVKSSPSGQFENVATMEALADCVEDGDGSVCGIYFSFANISDASDDFGVRLEEVYKRVQPRLKVVQVVLWAHVGTPEGPVEREAGFRRCLTGKPWYAVPFHDVDTKNILSQVRNMHEKLVIASSLCVIAAGLQRKRLIRRKLKCAKKRRLDSDALSDNEIEQPSQSHNTQDEEETSDFVDSNSEHISTEEENSDNESVSDDSESDDIQRKVSETLDQVLKLFKRENEKEDDVCHSFARLIEYKLRNLPEANQYDLMYEIQCLFYKNAMQSLNGKLDNSVGELQPTEERPHSTSSFPELDEAAGGE